MAGDPWPGRDLEADPWPGQDLPRGGVPNLPRLNGPSVGSTKRLGDRLGPFDPNAIRIEDQRAAPVSLNGDAVDGDTLGTFKGPNLRLYGIDAPEADQQGWDRAGLPVPIGRRATSALDALVTPEAIAGDYMGASYGRPVATVDQDGEDVGRTQLRLGDALAAPSYMGRTPDLAQNYMEAERLARQNRLGVHGVYAQTPSDFRHSPDPAPDRETVAVFWDTPTPFAGLRPEIEAGYQQVLRKGTAEQILDYAKANYFTLKPGDVATYVRKRDAGTPVSTEVTYADAPAPLTDQGDGAVGAASRGLGSGTLANFLDEAGAVVDTLGGTQGRENLWNSDRRLADIVANNWRQNEAILGYDDLAHPYARLGGEIAGGLVVPFGAKATSALDLAKVGGAYGFAAGFGSGDSVPDRLTRGIVGTGIGTVGGVVAGKTLQAALPKLASGWRWVRGRDGQPVAVPEEALQGAPGASVGDQAAQAPQRAPEPPVGLPEGVPPPPEGFTVDAPMTAGREMPQTGNGLPTPREMAMAADAGPALTTEVRPRDYLDLGGNPRPLLSDPTEAELRAAAEGIEPRDVLPIGSSEIGSVEEAARIDAGRIVEARPQREGDALTRRTLRAWNGAEVPKLGPIDLVGWLRLRGGLKNQGGELRGFDNRARKLDFAGQEARFGPLVNDQSGMNLDDAAHAAWEAGYFPELSERPYVNTFLDALRGTYEGRQRRFLPEDLGEIDAFEAARAERYDLESRRFEEGAPIYTDRSVPADEPAPSAPVEAYEEWPSGGPDFAGNIRLDKLESPQDIKRALATVNNRVGFDAATRGRVAHAETERLADELGMTADQLLARRKGQALNAEEALAARQILAKSGNELVNLARRIQRLDNPGDEEAAAFQRALLRHVAIQEQVSGATAEAGRALQQFRMTADSRAVRSEVLASIVNAGGGGRRIKDAADALLDAVELGPGQFNTLAGKLTKPRFRDKIAELWINSLLSGPQTHVVNVVSNTLTSLAQIPEHVAGATIGAGRRAVGQADDAVTYSEVGARAFGLLQGTKEGLGLAARTFRTGEPSDLISKVEGQGLKAISGRKGEVIRLPTRALSAEDELFKGMARRMELSGLAVRQARKEGLRGEAAQARVAELVASPTDDMLARSMDYARYLTFQRPVGGVALGLQQAAQKQPLLKFLIPFVRTPTNLVKFAAERSPAAPLIKEWRADFMAGGARRDLAVAKALVGTGFGAVMYEAALKGLITGSPPADEAKARLLRADGWQPYSVRIGDKYYSYLRLDPFSTTIGVAADLATKKDGMSDKQLDDYAVLLTASIIHNLSDKTWLSGTADFLQAVNDPQRYGKAWLRKMAGSMAVPGLVAQTARALDPVSRVTHSPLDAIKARIPGLSDNLPARRDIWGEAITNEGGLGPDLLSPIWQSTRKNDPVTNELLTLGARFDLPQKSYKAGGKSVEWTPQQYDRLSELAGKRAHDTLGAAIADPAWKGLSPDARLKQAGKAFRDARANARGELLGDKPAANDGWPGRELTPAPAKDGWPGSDLPQRDVVGGLLDAVPGLTLGSFTSGFRTPEYQADMRRRGYRPADNSGHLDGASLDIVPPRGKSVGWLMQRVAAVEPGARLLPEGDHLHATFPGWFGAPVLGGAKAAGLRNPMATR